jgi:hypothetical protein
MKLFSVLVLALLFTLSGEHYSQNYAIQVDGQDDYLQVYDNASLDLTSPFSICAWYYYVSGFSGEPGLVQKDGESSWGRYGIWIFSNRVDFCITPNGPQQCLFPNTTLNENAWNYIAAVFDGVKMMVYINGISVGINQFSLPASTSSNSLYIGADPTENLFLKGRIDEVTIWNRALSQSHIQKFMADVLQSEYYLTQDSGLAAYYKFDQFENLGINNDGADDIRDFSAFANHGDAQGSPVLVGADWITSVEDEIIQKDYYLYPNFPNPFNSSTIIKYSIPEKSNIRIIIYDALGRELTRLVDDQKPAGLYELTLDAFFYPSGVYFLKMQAGPFSETRKLLLMK